MGRDAKWQRLATFTVEDADAMIVELQKTLKKLQGLRKALTHTEERAVAADGRKMAEAGLKRINTFIGNCITKAEA